MDAATEFQQIGIALGLGLLVGLQRQHSTTKLAGLRTFPLFTVAGTLTAMVDQRHSAGGWIIAAGLVSVVGFVVGSDLRSRRSGTARPRLTTKAAILLMYTVGAYLVGGHSVVAVAVGTGTAVLLHFKPELHRLVERLGDADLRAIMQFALFSGVILPVLPNRVYGPYGVLNPFEIWLMVVLIVFISLTGYVVYKSFGRNVGILLGGILGGAISSTATTVSYSKRAATNPGLTNVAAVVIMIASSVLYLRVLVELAVVAPSHITELGGPIATQLLVSLLTVGLMWKTTRTASDEMPQQDNPTEFKSAVFFAALYAIVLLALAAAKEQLGNQGMFAVAILSGLTDMDAITLSTARLLESRRADAIISTADGWRLIVAASLSNLVFKLLIISAIGPRPLLLRLTLLFAVPIASGIGLILFWK